MSQELDRAVFQLYDKWPMRKSRTRSRPRPTIERLCAINLIFFFSCVTVRLRSGPRFSKVPKTFRARKAIRKTPTRLFC